MSIKPSEQTPSEVATIQVSQAMSHYPEDILFPKLNDAQMERVRNKGIVRHYQDGETVWSTGDKAVSCFFVESGEIVIWVKQSTGEREVTRHGPGCFSGDINQLNGQPVVVSATTHGETTLIEIPRAVLKNLVVQDSDLSDVLITAFLARRGELLAQGDVASLILIGSEHDQQSHSLREFLTRNHVPFVWLQPGQDDALNEFLGSAIPQPEQFPAILCANGELHTDVDIPDLARLTGLLGDLDDHLFDVAVIGAGPGGLAATVYAASEGLDVITIDRLGPGGQAGSSSKIENYLGFPAGISGSHLAAAALTQANKFGAKISVAHEASTISCDQPGQYDITVANGTIRARSVVIATGAAYRRLPIKGGQQFDGRGVYYGATAMEAQFCVNQEIILVGGGNSAGQAAVYLSRHARQVHIFIRRDSLVETMSDYLIQRIEEAANITLHPQTEITALYGDEHLDAVDSKTHNGEQRRWNISNLFLFIGASPATEWLNGCLCLDKNGFIRTGSDLELPDLINSGWSTPRHPVFLEASKPGIYAVGDVRSGSTKRVASAVGEGSMVIHHVHRYLAESRAI